MKIVTVKQIMAANTIIETPFQLDAGNQQHWQVEQILRVMPDKRMIARAIGREGKTVLLKLFFKTRNFQQELKGYQALEKTGVSTPRRLLEQAFAEGGLCSYEFIDHAQSFGTRWRTADKTTKAWLLEQLLTTVQRLYEGKVCQIDLHLGNFIFSGEAMYALDPASCEALCDQGMKRDNLALLVAQFEFRDWPQVTAAITAHFSDIDKEELWQHARMQYKNRTKNFLQKIYRECTQVRAWSVPIKKWQHLDIYCERERCSPDMQALLENFGDSRRDVACYVSTNTETLKQGNSSIVSSTVVDGKKIVVKNSRNKNIWRLLRRCFRRSRASNSWCFSHWLQQVGIFVPAPIALVERRFGPFVIESWFVSEHIEGDNLLDVWLYQEPSQPELLAVRELFSVMRHFGISHGDMKATNLLVKDEQIFVIDYDGMRQHKSKNSARAAIQRDKERLLENWKSADVLAAMKEL